jgi:serine/threonine protein kinase
VDPYGLVGQVLDGQFRVDAPVGEGGFSVVYRGHHLGLDEPVAIKCLKLQAQLGSAIVETFVRRFRDESKIHYKLSQGSLNVARTIAAGTTMAPATHALVPYMVLEWLDGFPLSEQLRARRDRGERGRPLDEVIKLLDPIAEALALAHSLGVVHRDINPSNLFCQAMPGGGFRLKVMDFGVAKIISDHALALGPRQATLGSIRMFTPAYGAPEQFGDGYGVVSAATDVYAFALLVVELLLDRTPVTGEHLGDYLEKAIDPMHRPTPRTLGATVGDAVEGVLAQALAVDPSRRPSDVGAFWGLLKNAASRDVETRRSTAPPPGSRLTSKGTVIMPEMPSGSSPPPAAGPAPRSRLGGGGTQPIKLPAHLMAPPVPVIHDPQVDAYGPTHPGADGRRNQSPLSSTLGNAGPPVPVDNRLVQTYPSGGSTPTMPRGPEAGGRVVESITRPAPPMPVARRRSNGPIFAVAAVAIVVLGVVGWAFVRFVL